MVTARFAPADGDSFTAELSIDGYRLLTGKGGPLLAPAALSAGAVPPGRAEVARRDLLDARLLATDGAPHPLLAIALLLLRATHRHVAVTSWTPTTTSTTLGTAADALTSTVTLSLARDRTADTTDATTATDGLLRVSLGPAALAVQHLTALADDTDAPLVRAERHRIPIVAARAVVEAVRRRDEALVAEVARQVGAVEHVELLRGLADTMEAGLRLVASDDTAPRAVSEWFQASDGRWFTARLTAPDARPTVELLAESGELVIDVRPRSSITADVLALYASWARESQSRRAS